MVLSCAAAAAPAEWLQCGKMRRIGEVVNEPEKGTERKIRLMTTSGKNGNKSA